MGASDAVQFEYFPEEAICKVSTLKLDVFEFYLINFTFE